MPFADQNDQNSSCDCAMFFVDADKAVDKMKIESFVMSSKMADQNDDFIAKESWVCWFEM